MASKKISKYVWDVIRINGERTITEPTMKFGNTVLFGTINNNNNKWRCKYDKFSNNRLLLSNINIDEDYEWGYSFNEFIEQRNFMDILDDKEFRYYDIHNYRILKSVKANYITLKNPNHIIDDSVKGDDLSYFEIMHILESNSNYYDISSYSGFDTSLDLSSDPSSDSGSDLGSDLSADSSSDSSSD
jgi:hypothetical protein